MNRDGPAAVLLAGSTAIDRCGLEKNTVIMGMIAWRLDRDTMDLTGECPVSLYVISSSASLVFVAFFFVK
jgi:hypothetical protein